MHVRASLSYTKEVQIGVGQGMNSEVFIVNEPQLGGRLVVKEIPLSTFGNTVSKYFDEARAMFSTQHPNVVPIQYAAETATCVCLAMPHYKNGSAADRIAKGPLLVSESMRVMHDALAGLAHIHAAGFVHFDVKPSNILFSNANRALVADFGQARSIDPTTGHATAPNLYWGGVPPEAISGAATPAADCYQAGLLFYRLVNGDSEWRTQQQTWAKWDPLTLRAKIANGKVPNRGRFLPHVPPGIRRVIRHALKTDPVARYQSATEFDDALGRVPLSLDWACSQSPNGEMEWRVDRVGQPALVVRLVTANKSWSIRVYTRSPAGERAKDRATLWRKSMSIADAEVHLADVVFSRLS